MWKQELQLTSPGILEPKWPDTCPMLGQNGLAFKRYLTTHWLRASLGRA